jgi:hypothetical protein
MTPWIHGITGWLADVFVHATVLLTVVAGMLPWIRHPARRITVAWGTLLGLVLVAALPAFPHRPLVVLPGWANIFERPDRPPLKPDMRLVAVRETQQSLDIAEPVKEAAKPQADRERDAAIDERINDAIPIDPPESSEEFAVLEPEQSAASNVAHLDFGVPAFEATGAVASATPDSATRRWSEAALAVFPFE